MTAEEYIEQATVGGFDQEKYVSKESESEQRTIQRQLFRIFT